MGQFVHADRKFNGPWTTDTNRAGYLGSNFRSNLHAASVDRVITVDNTQIDNTQTDNTPGGRQHRGGGRGLGSAHRPMGLPWHRLPVQPDGLRQWRQHRHLANGRVVADAIRLEPIPYAEAATWNAPVSVAGSYKLYLRTPEGYDLARDAKYFITHAGGQSVYYHDQRENNGAQ